jgi:hypothetical protein
MTTALSRFLAFGAGLAAAAMLAAAPALANGGDFFEELSSTWSGANADQGVPYFGFIKDSKGKGIAGAAVSATTASGSTFVVQTDNMGHYRIPGFSKSVDAKLVQITCAKTGYRLIARDRRIMRSKADAPVETNCVLAPDGTKPTS